MASDRRLSMPDFAKDDFTTSTIHHVDATDPLDGVESVIDHWGVSKHSYEIALGISHDETANLTALYDLMERVHGPANAVWITSPVAQWLSNLKCGEGNAAKTVFPFPMRELTGTARVYVDDVLDGSATVDEPANMLLADDDADFEGGVAGWQAVGGTPPTLGQTDEHAYHGRYCLEVTNGTSQADFGAELVAASLVAVDTSTNYTGFAWVRGACGNVQAVLRWYNGSKVYQAESIGSSTTIYEDRWTAVPVTASSSSYLYAGLAIRCPSTTTEGFWIDCAGITLLADSYWWLPSLAPYVAELSAAPGSGEVVTGAGYGKLCVPCRLRRDGIKRRPDARGNVFVRSTEWIESWRDYG